MKKIIYIGIIIILIFAGSYAAKQMSEEKETTQTGANVVNNLAGNITNNNEKNETVENNITESEVNEIENNIQDETTTTLNPEEEAKQIVKDNWGEDDSVYFSYDGVKDGKHVVCVRDVATTKALYRYYVNVETGAFEIE